MSSEGNDDIGVESDLAARALRTGRRAIDGAGGPWAAVGIGVPSGPITITRVKRTEAVAGFRSRWFQRRAHRAPRRAPVPMARCRNKARRVSICSASARSWITSTSAGGSTSSSRISPGSACSAGLRRTHPTSPPGRGRRGPRCGSDGPGQPTGGRWAGTVGRRTASRWRRRPCADTAGARISCGGSEGHVRGRALAGTAGGCTRRRGRRAPRRERRACGS
jgi:hypothetical protein